MTNYRSEIRDEVISDLENKVSKTDYGSYLRRVVLKKVRGFNDRIVNFDFPVTALVGPNGGGKSTILGAAGLIYKGFAPSDFFAKSGKYDASMMDWRIEYELIEKRLSPRLHVQRTASFPKLKWNRNAIERPVLKFGVSRTLPATERRELGKAVGSKFVANEVIEISKPVIEAVERILGKEMKGCSRLSVDSQGKATLFALSSPDGNEYSEFHFGAGEASVIKMVFEIEEAPANTLILIEEIENGLHPVATRKMVEHLIDVASRKSCQVIFTTHSNEALSPLPSQAIWAAYNGEVLQGKLDIFALRTITGQIDAALAVFVEDNFAERVMTAVFRHYGNVELQTIKIHGMGGAGPAIAVNKQHNLDPTSSFPSVCILDGDQRERENASESVYCLPGTGSPEQHIFGYVHENIETLAARLAAALNFKPSFQERVKSVVRSRALTNRDRHVIFEQIGTDLDLTPEAIVSSAFIGLWAQENSQEVEELVGLFKDKVPLSDSGKNGSQES